MTWRVSEKNLGYGPGGCNVRVQVLERCGDDVNVQVDDCGVLARSGDLRTVPADALLRRDA